MFFDLCYGTFAFFPVDYVGVIFLAVLLLVFGIHASTWDSWVVDAVSNVGAYSYWVLCIHSIEQKCLPWEGYINQTAAYPNISFFFALIIKAVIITVFCLIIKNYNKRRYRKRKQSYD